MRPKKSTQSRRMSVLCNLKTAKAVKYLLDLHIYDDVDDAKPTTMLLFEETCHLPKQAGIGISVKFCNYDAKSICDILL
jgi:hypothetical protein